MPVEDRLERWFHLAPPQREPLFILGPCAIESQELLLEVAAAVAELSRQRDLLCVLKASFDKANRTSLGSFRGPGLEAGLRLLAIARAESGLPVCTDIHEPAQAPAAAAVVDLLQVPAFLCRQTSLLLEVGRRARAVNLKRGPFVAPEDMAGSVEKLRAGGAEQILLTERGSSFGYNRLVADLTAIPLLQRLGVPVAFDATHIVRRYGIPSDQPEGGDPELVPVLARAGVAAGADALFLETHPEPRAALCDAASMLPLDALPGLLDIVLPIAEVVR